MAKTTEVRRKLLTCNEAAEVLALSVPTIRAWIARHKLPYVKLGGAIRIPADALEEMIAANIVPARKSRGEVNP